MIKIRYRGSNELSPGLHATAERHGRTTTVYLLSGMTAAQRRSALRRLRLTARMGHCPQLPAAQLGFALFTDRIRTGFGRAGAVLRLHPAGSTVPIMVLSGGAIAFLLFSTVSIHVLHPKAADQSDTGTSPVASASAIAIAGGAQSQASGLGGPGSKQNPGDPGGPADPSGLSRGSQARQLTQPSRGSATALPVLAAGGQDTGAISGSGSGGSGSGGSGSGGSGSTGSGSGGSGSGTKNSSGKSSADGTAGGTTLSGGANPTQSTPQQSTPATSAPAPAPAGTTPATTPSSSGTSSSSSSGGVCVNVGSLGVCLDI
jgi:hypothetical protein